MRPDEEGNGDIKKKAEEAKHTRKAKQPSLDEDEENLNISPELQIILESNEKLPELPFKESDELIEIFSEMQEQNLLQIQRMQDAEQQLELKKAHMNRVTSEMTAKLDALCTNELNNRARIARTEKEKEALETVGEENQSQVIDRASMEKIEGACLELYILCKGLSNKKRQGKNLAEDPEFKKLSQADILTMLAEIEYFVDSSQTKFKQYEAVPGSMEFEGF